ncbi:(3R)-3-hydroxyacyl-CoA dehydrogenase [Eurosta solidaginis]|uniref:(3R)-3-hydroxyacyl-CoA dehydrogenase n=1 Tax=Eurosta solidaginis TaxID=178769 RepID=UPI00353158D2
MGLIGKLAIVTGAGSGIGRATCRLLARDGAKVIAADRNMKSAEQTVNEIACDNVIPLKLDVSSLASVSKSVTFSIEHFMQPPSIVINSAGITRDGYLLKLTEKDYDEVYEVNLKGTFLMTQQFARAMIEHQIRNGTIINLSSIVARMNNPGQANYAATKAGVISLSEIAAKEFGKFGIRVNAILPGFINTPMVDSVPEKIKTDILQRCPMGRLGRPEEIANVIAFLASEKSSYVNGAAIPVTGGL